MGIIKLNEVSVYAHHGCFDVEQKVGQWYKVNVSLEVDFSKAELSDDLNDAIDYCIINDIVQQEMAISSRLIEHVAGRIKNKIKTSFPQLLNGSVSIKKLQPPVIGKIESVEVISLF